MFKAGLAQWQAVGNGGMPLSTQTTPRTQIIVDFADMKCSNNPTGKIKTATLGSCVAVAIWDPELHIGGVLQYMLPDSYLARERALNNPYFFADTGIPLLFRKSYKLGAVKERIVCKLAGGAAVRDPSGTFEIGQSNQLAARKVLGNNGITVRGESLGGCQAMELVLFLENGRTLVRLANGVEIDL